MLALTYEDIDLEKRCITINKSYQRLNGKDMITPPKTPKSNRQISIPPFLAEELKEYCSMLYGITANERMFRFTKSFMEHEMVRGIKETGVRRIRLHDLRHPYVKHTTKKYNSEKQKTQATKIDLIAWVFCFCINSYSKEVMDLVNNLNAVVGKDTHLFNQQIGQLGG